MKITVIGSGNIATHLAENLHNEYVEIVQIFSRNITNAQTLAQKVGAEPIDNLRKLSPLANVCVFAVPDDAIADLLQANAPYFSNDTLLIHTAGSVPIDVFKDTVSQFGVMYPLQTFSKNRAVNFADIPVFIEGNTAAAENKIRHLAQKISSKIYTVNFEQRRQLHLAAVFACNFPNFLYHIAGEIIKESHLNFEVLRPLIVETARKIEMLSPAEAQTGPAARGDMETMQKHLKLLENHPQWQELYKISSKEIEFISANFSKN